MNSNQKENLLKEILLKLNGVAVAFSGGVDSTYLLAVSHDLLGDRAIAITGRSLSFPLRELNQAKDFTKARGIKHLMVDSEELDLPDFSNNPPNRCYLCKHELFTKIKELAAKDNLQVIEASNADDEGDYRPGLTAIAELEIISPLRQARLTKEEIRELSHQKNLPTWDKPSFACLASRFPYGEKITPDFLRRIDLAEQFLLDLGLKQVRVRFHDQGRLARIETDEDGLVLTSLLENRIRIHQRFLELGFTYTAVDIKGYRTGSMNATLPAVQLTT